MTDSYSNVSVLPGGSESSGKKTVSRPDPARYRRYDWWYKNETDLFDKLKWGKELSQVGREQLRSERLAWNLAHENRATIKALRNPIHRHVEFYAASMLRGTAKQAFPLRELEKQHADALRDAIWTLWGWSNLDAQKQVLKRLVAKHGLAFIAARSPQGVPIVHKQVIKAEHVSDYSRDERGNINYIRLDVPIEPSLEEAAEQDFQQNKKTHTEIWKKGGKSPSGKASEGYYRTWVRDRDATETQVVAEKDLGTPETNLRLSESLGKASLRFDFVPFVDIMAMDTGEKWPCPLYEHALPLIMEAMKMATRYHDLLFIYNKPHRAVQGIGNDASGRPYPAPAIPGADRSINTLDQDTVPFAGEMARLLNAAKSDETLGGDIWINPPGNAEIADITPNIDFEAQRRALLDEINEIKKELPELLYFETLDKAELSGRALRLIMSGAVDRTLEMRGNIENALVKWDKMALTMAQVKGLKGFEKNKIGTYNPDTGFKHSFEEQDVIAVSDLEDEELRGRRIANMIALMEMGLSAAQAAQEVGMTHLSFEPREGGPGMLPVGEMQPGTGGNPGGGTNLEGAARRIAANLRGSDAIFPPR